MKQDSNLRCKHGHDEHETKKHRASSDINGIMVVHSSDPY